MKKILLGLCLLSAGLVIPKTAKAQFWGMPANAGDSLQLTGRCLDSLGYPIICDSVRYYLERWTTTGWTHVDSSTAASVTPSGTGRFTQMKGFDLTHKVGFNGQTTVGIYRAHAIYYSRGGLGGNLVAKTPVDGYFNVGLVTATDYLAAADDKKLLGTSYATPTTAGILEVELANTATHGGAAFLLTGDRLAFTSTSGAAWTATGQGAGAGAIFTGGATGNGITSVGGGTSGHGFSLTTTSGDGITSSGGTNGVGFRLAGAGSGSGFRITGGATGPGMAIIGGGTSGDGINITATSGDGINSTGNATGNVGLRATGNGTGAGILGIGGNTSPGPGMELRGGTAAQSSGLLVKGGSTSGAAESLIVVSGTRTEAHVGAASAEGVIFAQMDSVLKAPRTHTSVTTVTGNVNGNVTGSVGSVTGAVGSVAAGGIAAASFAAGAIDSTAINATARRALSREGADSVWRANFVDQAVASSGGMIIDSAKGWGQTGAAGSGDWTAAERNQIRLSLGIDGTHAEPATGDTVGVLGYLRLMRNNTSGEGRVILSNSNAHGGAAFVLTGDRIALTSTSGAALTAAGNGAGAGARFVGGATGNAIEGVGGATSGDALNLTTTSGDGAEIDGGTNGLGLNVNGAGTGAGARFSAANAGTGNGMQIRSGLTTNSSAGLLIEGGGGGGAGMHVHPSTTVANAPGALFEGSVSGGTGNGIQITGSGEDAVLITGPNTAAKSGIRIVGGNTSTSHAVSINAGTIGGGVGLFVKGSTGNGAAESLFVTGGNAISAKGSGTNIGQVGGIDTARAIGGSQVSAIFDSLSMAAENPANLVRDASFEGNRTLGEVWAATTGTVNLVRKGALDAYIPSGRFALLTKGTGAATGKATSDTMSLTAGTRLIFGAQLFSGNPSAANIALVGGTTFSLAGNVVLGTKWHTVVGYALITSAGVYRVELTGPGSAGTDSARWDNVFVIPIMDSLSAGGGGGGSCTVTFSSGSGAFTFADTVRDSATLVAQPQVIMSLRDSATQTVQAVAVAGPGGNITVNLAGNTGYYYKFLKTGIRAMAGRDSNYLRINAANVNRRDSVVVINLSAAPSGQTRVYAYETDQSGNGIPGMKVTARLATASVGGLIQFAGTDSAKWMNNIPKITYTSSHPDSLGLWYLDLIPPVTLQDTLSSYTISVEGVAGSQTVRKLYRCVRPPNAVGQRWIVRETDPCPR